MRPSSRRCDIEIEPMAAFFSFSTAASPDPLPDHLRQRVAQAERLQAVVEPGLGGRHARCQRQQRHALQRPVRRSRQLLHEGPAGSVMIFSGVEYCSSLPPRITAIRLLRWKASSMSWRVTNGLPS